MSEERWLSATTAGTLLKLTKGRTTDRKLRLCACGCIRQIEEFATHADVSELLDMVERGLTADELRRRRIPFYFAFSKAGADYHAACEMGSAVTDANARNGAKKSLDILIHKQWPWRGAYLTAVHAALIREVFGNPFRPLDFVPWRTDTAVTLARTMYEPRDFGAMPILADALQDAGCDNDEVLRHCRDATQLHVRGCWVVDGVLGLE